MISRKLTITAIALLAFAWSAAGQALPVIDDKDRNRTVYSNAFLVDSWAREHLQKGQ